jgi:glucose-6-phosphate isomerase
MTIDGPLAAHYADGVPSIIIEIDELTPEALGKYHYMLMKSTGIQGYLLGHNPFIQPGVQFWKDKLFTMAGKPGYEKQHAEYKASLATQKNEKVINF